MGYALRAKQAGQGFASSVSSGRYASLKNRVRHFNGGCERMRLCSMLFCGRDALLLGGRHSSRSQLARRAQHRVSSFMGAGSSESWAPAVCKCAEERNMVECGREVPRFS
jgi:hypothetical protein